jgi:hypothetical protein
MEWWQWVVTVAGSTGTAMMGIFLKSFFSYRVEFASFKAQMTEWVKGQDAEVILLREITERHDKRFEWGASKINGLLQWVKLFNYRLLEVEKKVK